MKTTFELYRCSPLEWNTLPYEDALEYRALKAKEAMAYYKTQAESVSNKFSENYNKHLKLRIGSENALKWNKRFLEEIKIEKDRIENEQN